MDHGRAERSEAARYWQNPLPRKRWRIDSLERRDDCYANRERYAGILVANEAPLVSPRSFIEVFEKSVAFLKR